jgi:hypothetical protein
MHTKFIISYWGIYFRYQELTARTEEVVSWPAKINVLTLQGVSQKKSILPDCDLLVSYQLKEVFGRIITNLAPLLHMLRHSNVENGI